MSKVAITIYIPIQILISIRVLFVSEWNCIDTVFYPCKIHSVCNNNSPVDCTSNMIIDNSFL